MKNNYQLIVVMFVVCSFFINVNQANAENLPSVIINEFSSTTNPEWVELLNTTGTDFVLTDWKLKELSNPSGPTPTETDWVILSGTIPAYGILVFEVSGTKLNNPGDSISLYDNNLNLIQRITYGNVNGYPATAGLETTLASGKSGVYISGEWRTNQTPTKGQYNSDEIASVPTFNPASGDVSSGTTITISSDGANHIYYTTDGIDPATSVTGSTLEYSSPIAISQAVTIKAIAVKIGLNKSEIGSALYTIAVPPGDPIADAFDVISNTLIGNNIENNLDEVTGTNVMNFSGLFFEKRTDILDASTALGRITFNSSLDLSKEETKTFLQNLGTKMDMTEAGEIGLDFRGATSDLALLNVSATIKFYGLNNLGFNANSTVEEIGSKLIALDDSGIVIDKSTLISELTPSTYLGACEVGGGCYVFTVSVNHFTKYKIDEVGKITPNEDGEVILSGETKEVVITNDTQAVNVTVAGGTTDTKINVSAFIDGGIGILPAINIISNNAGNATVTIPPATTVTSADISWDGILATPTITTLALPITEGVTKSLSMAIEIGFTGAKLSFDKAVRILLPNQAGKKVGYAREGIAFTEIINICGADDQATGNALLVDGDCKINVGNDMVIWTKHFTSFATYTETTNSNSGSSGSSPRVALLNAPTEKLAVNTFDGCDKKNTGYSTTTGMTCEGNPNISKKMVAKAKDKSLPEVNETIAEPEPAEEKLTESPAEEKIMENNLTASAGTVSGMINKRMAFWIFVIIALGLGIGFGIYRFGRKK